jgi:hypothetical protein
MDLPARHGEPMMDTAARLQDDGEQIDLPLIGEADGR